MIFNACWAMSWKIMKICGSFVGQVEGPLLARQLLVSRGCETCLGMMWFVVWAFISPRRVESPNVNRKMLRVSVSSSRPLRQVQAGVANMLLPRKCALDIFRLDVEACVIGSFCKFKLALRLRSRRGEEAWNGRFDFLPSSQHNCRHEMEKSTFSGCLL